MQGRGPADTQTHACALSQVGVGALDSDQQKVALTRIHAVTGHPHAHAYTAFPIAAKEASAGSKKIKVRVRGGAVGYAGRRASRWERGGMPRTGSPGRGRQWARVASQNDSDGNWTQTARCCYRLYS